MMIPSKEEFVEIVLKAKEAGEEAARIRMDQLKAKAKPEYQLLDSCGGAHIVLNIDGRTKIGKFLLDFGNHEIFSISKYLYGYSIHIRGMAQYQERSVCEAAAEAALNVITQSLGIAGSVSGYDS